jgi:hypothetical protein
MIFGHRPRGVSVNLAHRDVAEAMSSAILAIVTAASESFSQVLVPS